MISEMEKMINEGNVSDLDKNLHRDNPDVEASSLEKPKKPTKRECPYNLSDISIEDVIGFFNDNEYWKGYCQKIMDQEIHESKCKRHIHALTTRDLGLFSYLTSGTNICFLRQYTEKGENADIILLRQARWEISGFCQNERI